MLYIQEILAGRYHHKFAGPGQGGYIHQGGAAIIKTEATISGGPNLLPLTLQ